MPSGPGGDSSETVQLNCPITFKVEYTPVLLLLFGLVVTIDMVAMFWWCHDLGTLRAGTLKFPVLPRAWPALLTSWHPILLLRN